MGTMEQMNFMRRHPLFVLLLTGGVLRLCVWVSFVRTPELFVYPDSDLYLILARNLADHGVFQRTLDPGSPAETFRTPAYPAFIAICFKLAGESLAIVALAQIVLGLLSVWLAMRFASEAFHPHAGIIAAGLVALNPGLVYHDNVILSENLYTFFLLASVYGVWRFGSCGGYACLIVSAVGLALSVLTRPIGQFLWPLMILFLIASLWRQPRRMIMSLVIWSIVYGAIIGGWMMRNYYRIGSAKIATIAGLNLLETRAASVRIMQTGKTYGDIAPELYAELDDRMKRIKGETWTEAEREAEATKMAKEIIRDNLWTFLAYEPISLARLYMGRAPSFYQIILFSEPSLKPQTPAQRYARIVWVLIQAAFWAVIYTSTLVMLYSLVRKRDYPTFLLFALNILYPAVVMFGACTTYHRYRIPIEPYFAILAGGGLAMFAFRLEKEPGALPDLSKPLRIAAFIPVYNEHDKIKRLLDEFPFDSIEKLIVVDDGSDDGTEKLVHNYPVDVIRHETNQGIGVGLRDAIRRARELDAQVFVVMAGNGKDDPREIPVVVEPIAAGRAVYVQGSRFKIKGYHENTPKFRAIAIRLYTMVFNLLSPYKCTDLTNGFRAYRLDLLDDPRINLDQAWLDRYEMEYYIHFKAFMLGYPVEEVAVHKRYPAEKTASYTKIRPFHDWWKMIRPMVYLFLRIKK